MTHLVVMSSLGNFGFAVRILEKVIASVNLLMDNPRYFTSRLIARTKTAIKIA